MAMLNSNMIFHRMSYTVKFKVAVVEWQRQNEASVHRPVKEFTTPDFHHCASEDLHIPLNPAS